MHRQTHPTHGCTCRPSLLSTHSSTLTPNLTPTPTPLAGTTRQTSIGRVVPASKVGVGVGFGVGVGVGVVVRVIMISVGPCQGLLYTGAYLQCGARHVEQPFQLILEAWYRCMYVEGGAQLPSQLPSINPCQAHYPFQLLFGVWYQGVYVEGGCAQLLCQAMEGLFATAWISTPTCPHSKPIPPIRPPPRLLSCLPARTPARPPTQLTNTSPTVPAVR